jgi:long-chain acyl-CoA synthetase
MFVPPKAYKPKARKMNTVQEMMEQLRQGPRKGLPFSVALTNSRITGRSSIYRHWQFQDALLTTLDPEVTTIHEMFEQSG